MERTLSSSLLSVTVQSRGAELSSIHGADNTEYLWQADPSVWGRHAPVLFPIVGKLANDHFEYAGRRYHLKQHGFARDTEFSLTEETADSLTFQMTASPTTRECYPFEFALEVSYRLVDTTVQVDYRVTNSGAGEMPFSIGAHPGFSLAWGPGDAIEDYHLQFERAETADTRHLDDDGLLSQEIERVLTDSDRLPLRADLFERDALIFLDLQSEKVSLRSGRHPDRSVTVEFPGFPYLGVWAKPGAPYVCIEPWHGHVDPVGVSGEIVHKPGIIRLDEGVTFACSHRIVIGS